MHIAQLLYQLQETDLSLATVRRRLAEIEAALGETEELRAAQQAVRSTETQLQRWRVTLRDRDLEIKSLNGKIKADEKLLYSGRVRNPKELKSLEDELHSLRRRLESMEDSLLEAMLTVERLENEHAAQEEALTRIRAEWQAAQDALLAEQADLRERLSRLQALRRQQAAAAGDYLRIYDDLLRRKGGRAVALLKDGVCQACGITLPTGEVQRARYGQELCFCSSCGRVLWAG